MERKEQLVSNFSSLAIEFEKHFQEIEDGLELRDVIQHEDGRTLYKNLCREIKHLQNVMASLHNAVEEEKHITDRFKENVKQLQKVEKSVDPMLVFVINNSSFEDDIDLDSKTESEASVQNKENHFPKDIKPKRKKNVPSLNAITDKDFQKVPKYMKSHLTLAQINAGVDEINVVLSKKYEFLNRPRKTLSLKDEKKRAEYLEQAKEVKGTQYSTFFVDEDIQQYTRTLRMKRKTKDSVFLVLRHLGRMKETHKGKLTRYSILCT